MTAKAIKLTADLIQRRDDMKILLGFGYESEVREIRKILRAQMKASDKSAIQTGFDMAKTMSAAGHDPSMLIAAMVDEYEGVAQCQKSK